MRAGGAEQIIFGLKNNFESSKVAQIFASQSLIVALVFLCTSLPRAQMLTLNRTCSSGELCSVLNEFKTAPVSRFHAVSIASLPPQNTKLEQGEKQAFNVAP